MRYWLVLSLGLPFVFTQWLMAASFADIIQPVTGETRIYGSPANGCLTGASTLPLQGEGYHVMRTERNRYYAHPETIAFITDMGHHITTNSVQQRILLIGDLSQPAGGRMPSDHASHQNGLDVDIWLMNINADTLKKQPNLTMQSVVNRSKGQLNSFWQPVFYDDLRVAAEDQRVERIFINPVIKSAMCELFADTLINEQENAAWLAKLRPWYGHDSHFHVRLNCPTNQINCQSGTPIPKGSGCNAELQSWIRDQQIPPPAQKKASPKKSPPPMPLACQNILNQYF